MKTTLICFVFLSVFAQITLSQEVNKSEIDIFYVTSYGESESWIEYECIWLKDKESFVQYGKDTLRVTFYSYRKGMTLKDFIKTKRTLLISLTQPLLYDINYDINDGNPVSFSSNQIIEQNGNFIFITDVWYTNLISLYHQTLKSQKRKPKSSSPK